jgi:hypothetical protein
MYRRTGDRNETRHPYNRESSTIGSMNGLLVSIADHDILGRCDETLPGRPLLQQVMKNGERLAAGRVSLAEARANARRELDRLPARVRGLEPALPAYQVEISSGLEANREALRCKYEDSDADRPPTVDMPGLERG